MARKKHNWSMMRGTKDLLKTADVRLKDTLGAKAFGGISVEKLKGVSKAVREGRARFNFNGYSLTVKQALFIYYLTDANNRGTFMDKKAALRSAGYDVKDDHSARTIGSRLIEQGEVKRALADYFNDDEIMDLINSGVRHKLKDFDDKDWVRTASFVAKCRGDFHHGTKTEITLTKQERDERLMKIEEMVGSEPILIEEDDGEEA